MLKLFFAARHTLISVKDFFANGEEGASLVEYGLLVALIAAVCIAAVSLLGAAVNNLYTLPPLP